MSEQDQFLSAKLSAFQNLFMVGDASSLQQCLSICHEMELSFGETSFFSSRVLPRFMILLLLLGESEEATFLLKRFPGNGPEKDLLSQIYVLHNLCEEGQMDEFYGNINTISSLCQEKEITQMLSIYSQMKKSIEMDTIEKAYISINIDEVARRLDLPKDSIIGAINGNNNEDLDLENEQEKYLQRIKNWTLDKNDNKFICPTATSTDVSIFDPIFGKDSNELVHSLTRYISHFEQQNLDVKI
jgi:hypothetical protein